MGCGYSDTYGATVDPRVIGSLVWHHSEFSSMYDTNCCAVCCAPPPYNRLLREPAGAEWAAATAAGFREQLEAAADQVAQVPMVSAGGRWRRVDVLASKNALERNWLAGANAALAPHGLQASVQASVVHSHNGSGPTTVHTLALVFARAAGAGVDLSEQMRSSARVPLSSKAPPTSSH